MDTARQGNNTILVSVNGSVTGAQIQDAIKEPSAYQSLDRSVQQAWSGKPVRSGMPLLWVAEDTTKYEPRRVYEDLINRYGYRPVGLDDQDFASGLEKIRRSDQIRRSCSLA